MIRPSAEEASHQSVVAAGRARELEGALEEAHLKEDALEGALEEAESREEALEEQLRRKHDEFQKALDRMEAEVKDAQVRSNRMHLFLDGRAHCFCHRLVKSRRWCVRFCLRCIHFCLFPVECRESGGRAFGEGRLFFVGCCGFGFFLAVTRGFAGG